MRGQEIRRMLEEGYSVVQIKNELSRKFNVSEYTIESQYYSILKEVSEVAKYDKEVFRAKLLSRAESIYKKAINANQFRTALEANMAQAKLLGLFDKQESSDAVPQIIEVSGRTEDAPAQLTGDTNETDE